MCGILVVMSPTGEIRISKKFGKRIRSIREMAYKQVKKNFNLKQIILSVCEIFIFEIIARCVEMPLAK